MNERLPSVRDATLRPTWCVTAVLVAALLAVSFAAQAGPDPFTAFHAQFRAAVARADARAIAALTRVPFLYEGRELDRAGVERIVPELFTPAVRRCFATAPAIAEEDRRVVFCAPYAFYFGRDGSAFRLLEFGADGEDAP